MSRRGPRPTVFVCIAPAATECGYISKIIQADNQNNAAKLFFEQTNIKAKTIHGPFRKKRAQIIENTRTLKFADKSVKAEYDGWEVTAFFLKEPEDCAYLIFVKRLDNKVLAAPKGTVVIPITDLKVIT